MTAAALRPDLFTHLFATRRSHPDKRDLAASVLSVLLHGGAVGAVIWASTALAPERPVAEPEPIPIFIATSETVVPGNGGPRGGGPPGRSIVLPSFRAPDLDVPQQPGPIEDPWAPPRGGQPGLTDSSAAGQPRGGDAPGMRNGFVVSTVLPQLMNGAEVQRALERNYPAMLRDAGIGGRVTLWLLVDENGRVIETDLREASGQAAFDSAAARVGQIMRFSPGRNREDRVKVWVSLPIVFRTR